MEALGKNEKPEFKEDMLPLYEAAAVRDENLQKDLLLREQVLAFGKGAKVDADKLDEINDRIAIQYAKLKRAA